MWSLKAHDGRVFPLPPGTVEIGRLADLGICLENPTLSRRHAQLDVTAATVTVRDLGSASGTYVNGKRITGDEPLREGDVLNLGNARLTLEHGGEVPKPAPLDKLTGKPKKSGGWL